MNAQLLHLIYVSGSGPCLLPLSNPSKGEHGLWDKQTEFELATRVPLIIKVPWKTAAIGQHTSSFTELVDLHPTIASLAGVPKTDAMQVPATMTNQIFGMDVSAVFDAPNASSLKEAAFSQWPSCGNIGKQQMCCTGRCLRLYP
jgi:arylsulfatase A-like enzyme